jgi:hypothetical protein
MPVGVDNYVRSRMLLAALLGTKVVEAITETEHAGGRSSMCPQGTRKAVRGRGVSRLTARIRSISDIRLALLGECALVESY